MHPEKYNIMCYFEAAQKFTIAEVLLTSIIINTITCSTVNTTFCHTVFFCKPMSKHYATLCLYEKKESLW